MTRTVLSVLAAASLIATAACSDADPVVPGATRDVLSSITVGSSRCVTLAEGTTFQLAPKGFDKAGAEITEDVTLKYKSADTSFVNASASGLLSATKNTSGMARAVAVEMTHGIVTKTDTVFVAVTPTAATPKGLTFFNLFGSMSVTKGSFAILVGTAVDNSDMPIDGTITCFSAKSNNVLVADQVGGALITKDVGKVWIYGSANLYGTLVSDSVELTITDLTSAAVEIKIDSLNGNALSARIIAGSIVSGSYTQMYLAPGAAVSFANKTGSPATVTFSNPAGVTGGDITLNPKQTLSRTFPTVGPFTYTVTVDGKTATGRLDIR